VSNFVETQVELKYLLGEFKLFSIPFCLSVHDRHFTDIDFDLQAAETDFDDDTPGDGFYLESFPLADPLPKLDFKGKYIRYCPRQYNRYFIANVSDFDEYMAKFSSKSRSTIKKKVRKYDQHCQTGAESQDGSQDASTNLKEYRSVEEIKEFYRLARDLSGKTYQERLLDAGLPEGEEFERHLVSLAETQAVRGYLLFHGDTAVAYLYCPIEAGNVFVYSHLGYDPEYSNWSPGTVLQMKVLELLFAEGAEFLFDFTKGDGSHKKQFGNDCTYCGDVYYYKKTLKNRIFVLLHVFFTGFSKSVVTMMDKLKIKSTIKKFIRNKW